MGEVGSTSRPSREALVLAFGAIYVIWGSTYLAIRFAVETLPPLLMAGTRFLVAGSLLVGWSLWRSTERPTAAHWRSAAVIGGLLLFLGNGGVVLAEMRITSGQAALLVATVPFWMTLFASVRDRSWPSSGVAAGIVLGFLGVGLLVGPSLEAGEMAIDPFGALLVLGASCSWATGSLYSARAPLPRSPAMGSGMQMLMGGVLLTIGGLALGEGRSLRLEAFSAASIQALVYLIVFGSLVGFSAYAWLLRNCLPSQVSTYAYVNPVVAVLLGWGLGGEALTPRMGVAALIIVSSVALMTVLRSRSSAAGPPAAPRPTSPGSDADSVRADGHLDEPVPAALKR